MWLSQICKNTHYQFDFPQRDKNVGGRRRKQKRRLHVHSSRSARNTYKFLVNSPPKRIENQGCRDVKIRGNNLKGLG
jgi:hypothetical protein